MVETVTNQTPYPTFVAVNGLMFFLDSESTTPLFKQLYDQIREQILLGKLSADKKLPSVRDLASHLLISRNTVDAAYQELLAEGYIYSRSRSGYFVSPLDQIAAPKSLENTSRIPGPPAEVATRYRYDFHPARLDTASFPVRLWRKLMLECLREAPGRLSQYGDPQGVPELRFTLQNYLEHSRGVICEPQQVVITAGLQNSLDIVATLLKEKHSAVAFEDPGYTLAGNIFRNHDYCVVPVPVTENGIDVDLLAATSSSIAYVTPSHQLPMGYVMPIANRLRLLEWSEIGEHFILEDDYDSELRYIGKPIPSLQGLRPDGNVIYFGTFSKVLSPALRISYMVLPQSLLPSYRHSFQGYFCPVSQLEQRILAKFIAEGHWERHIRRMRNIYKKKHDATATAIRKHFNDRAQIEGQGAGLHLIVKLLGSACKEEELIAKAHAKGVNLFPFSWTCASKVPATTYLMLGFGGLTLGEIDQSVALLANLCF